MNKPKGPRFLRFFVPLIEALKQLDGSATSAEATDLVIENLNISEEEQEITNKNGRSRVRNDIAWARLYLVKSGFMDSSRRGVWSLTEKGLKAKLSQDDALNFFKEVQSQFVHPKEAEEDVQSDFDEAEDQVPEQPDHRLGLLSLLKSLPPTGFEKLCQRLLRESGFEQVVVTGKTGDGGIDGHGILRINPFVSLNVLFQCKRYQGSVSASQVRDFRGAMLGRTDKGIMITTGSFSLEAKKEARRDGAPPVELVDGDKLVEMFELLELGVSPRKVYEIEDGFFEDFRNS